MGRKRTQFLPDEWQIKILVAAKLQGFTNERAAREAGIAVPVLYQILEVDHELRKLFQGLTVRKNLAGRDKNDLA